MLILIDKISKRIKRRAFKSPPFLIEKKNKFGIIIFLELIIVITNFIDKGVKKCQINLDIFLTY